MPATSNRARVIKLIRQRAKHPPARGERRLPRQVQPDLIELEYFKALRPIVERIQRRFQRVAYRVFLLLISYRRWQDRGGGSGRDDDARADAGEEQGPKLGTRAVSVDDLAMLVTRDLDKGRKADVERAYQAGRDADLPAIKVAVGRDGGMEIIDGNHRLAVAREQGATRIKVKFVRGVEGMTGIGAGVGTGGEARQAAQIVEAAAKRAVAEIRPREIEAVAAKFGRATTDFQRMQLDAQVRAAFGVPFSAIERPIRDLVPLFAKSNTELVKTVADRYWDRLARDVQDAFTSGMHAETLAARFEDVDGMAESDARRLARDQIGKLNAQVNQERQEALGVTGYVWRTMNDNRVRDDEQAGPGRGHEEREGVHFEWSDPPLDGHPGEAIQCRCYAEPDFSPIINAAR